MASFAGRPRVVVCLLGAILLTPSIPILLHPASRILGHRRCDNPTQFFPFHDYAARCWLGGEAPLWNPHIMMGLPFLGEGQASVFHPLSAFFLFLPSGAAMNALIVSCFLLTGLAFYGYLRAIELGRAAAFFGAIVWSFSSIPIARTYAGHVNILMGFPAWPFILMCWHRYLRDQRLRNLALLSLGYGSLLLAAYPQSTYYFSLFFMMYVLLHGVGRRSEGVAAQAKPIGMLALFIVLGIGLGAVQLLPSLDFARNSFRSKSSYEFCTFFSLPPEDFITLLCPEFFGRTANSGVGQYWGRILFWEMWLYIGILPLLAALAGVLAAPMRRRLALGVPAAVFFVLALGRHTPIYQYFYDYVPLYDLFRSPSKHSMITVFCFVVFAAQGFQAWLDGLRSADDATTPPTNALAYRATVAFGIVLFAACLAVLIFVMPDAGADGSAWQRFMDWVARGREVVVHPADSFPTLAAKFASGQLWRASLIVLLCVALLVWLRRLSRLTNIAATSRTAMAVGAISFLLLVDFGTFFPHFLDHYDESQTRYDDAILRAMPKTDYPARYYDALNDPNLAMHYGLSTIGGYAGTTLRRFNRFVTQTQGFDPSESQATTKFQSIPELYLRLLAIDALHAPRSAATGDLPRTATGADSVMLDCRGHCPRAFLAESPKACASADDALAYALSSGVDTQASPAVETPEALPPASALDANEGVEIASFRANRVELAVTASRSRVVVLCEMYDEGWTARVNGAAAVVRPANFLFRAVTVPAGRSTVVFEYRPASFVVGAWVSTIAAMAIGLLLFRSPVRGLGVVVGAES